LHRQEDRRQAVNVPFWWLEAGKPEGLMHWSVSHFLSDLFPDIEHPAYQRPLEAVSFIVVTAALIGSLVAAIALVFYKL